MWEQGNIGQFWKGTREKGPPPPRETVISEFQGLQILLMSGVSVTSASQILESFWNIWSQESQRKKPF